MVCIAKTHDTTFGTRCGVWDTVANVWRAWGLSDCGEAQYRIDRGWYTCSPPPLQVISNLQAIQSKDQVIVTWTQSIAGTMIISVNGTVVNTVYYDAGSCILYLGVLSVGTHNICVVSS